MHISLSLSLSHFDFSLSPPLSGRDMCRHTDTEGFKRGWCAIHESLMRGGAESAARGALGFARQDAVLGLERVDAVAQAAHFVAHGWQHFRLKTTL